MWKPVPGDPGYEASDSGFIRSIDRKIVKKMSDGREIVVKRRGQTLKGNVNKDGYLPTTNQLGLRKSLLNLDAKCI